MNSDLDIIRVFNHNPSRAIQMLRDRGSREGLSKEEQDKSIASFFITHKGDLDPVSVGDYLGTGENAAVLEEFMRLMDFTNQPFLDAMREFLQSFKLPGEAQKIDRLVEAFGRTYLEQNNGREVAKDIANQGAAYVLAYQIIMLNTDLHNPRVKNKMDIVGLKRNLRRVNDGGDFSPEFLENLYDDIQNHPFEFTTSHKDTAYSCTIRDKKDLPLVSQLSRGLGQGNNEKLVDSFPALDGATMNVSTPQTWLSKIIGIIRGHNSTVKVEKDGAAIEIDVFIPGFFSREGHKVIVRPKEVGDIVRDDASIALAAAVVSKFKSGIEMEATYDYQKRQLHGVYKNVREVGDVIAAHAEAPKVKGLGHVQKSPDQPLKDATKSSHGLKFVARLLKDATKSGHGITFVAKLLKDATKSGHIQESPVTLLKVTKISDQGLGFVERVSDNSTHSAPSVRSR